MENRSRDPLGGLLLIVSDAIVTTLNSTASGVYLLMLSF